MKRLNSTEPWSTYCTALKTEEWLPRLTVLLGTLSVLSQEDQGKIKSLEAHQREIRILNFHPRDLGLNESRVTAILLENTPRVSSGHQIVMSSEKQCGRNLWLSGQKGETILRFNRCFRVNTHGKHTAHNVGACWWNSVLTL